MNTYNVDITNSHYLIGIPKKQKLEKHTILNDWIKYAQVELRRRITSRGNRKINAYGWKINEFQYDSQLGFTGKIFFYFGLNFHST